MSPSTLDPSKLNLTISKPGEMIPFGSGGPLLKAIQLVCSADQFPHWLATLGGGFTGTVLNPDKSIMGGAPPQVVQGTKIESGAVMALVFPSYVNSTNGFVITASYQGATGNATLTLGP